MTHNYLAHTLSTFKIFSHKNIKIFQKSIEKCFKNKQFSQKDSQFLIDNALLFLKCTCNIVQFNIMFNNFHRILTKILSSLEHNYSRLISVKIQYL